jgi:hypothetical protein
MEVLFKCGYVQHSFLCGRQTWKVSTQARADAVGSFFAQSSLPLTSTLHVAGKTGSYEGAVKASPKGITNMMAVSPFLETSSGIEV